MRKKSLLLQLFLSYLWIIVIALVALGIYSTYMAQDFHLSHIEADLHVRARLCSQRILELLAADDRSSVDRLCKTWGRQADTRFTVVLPNGEVIGDTNEDPARMKNHRDRPEIQEAVGGAVGHSTRFSSTTHEDRMYLAIAIPERGALQAVVRVSIPVNEVQEALSALQQKIVIAGLLSFALMAGATLYWLARRVTGPLHEMRDAVERTSDGALPVPFPESDSEEISELAEALEQMTARLASRLRSGRATAEGDDPGPDPATPS